MKFVQLIDLSRIGDSMTIFTKVVVHNLAQQYSHKKQPKYEADLVENKDYTENYLESQRYISEIYKIPLLKVSLVAALWNKTVLDYLYKYTPISSNNIKFSKCGLFNFVNLSSINNGLQKKLYATNRVRLDYKIYIYKQIFIKLKDDINENGYTFGLNPKTESEMITLLTDYLEFSFDTVQYAKHLIDAVYEGIREDDYVFQRTSSNH